MTTIWTPGGSYRRVEYKDEADLETTIEKVQSELFGANRIYLPIKRKIGKKGETRNIPDGYLIDLAGRKPHLYVVENEMAAHEPLRHIAVQILQFSLAYESEGRGIKTLLFEALQAKPELRKQCEKYGSTREFRNLDHLLEHMVFEAPFAALVIIDELPENLEEVLAKRFQFGVEVIEMARYENRTGERMYRFKPFLADVAGDLPPVEAGEADTVVVPARADGVEEPFLKENRWYAVRIHGAMRPQIKYLALYQVAPVSAITHIAEVKSIEPWKETGKCVVNFAGPAREITRIPMGKRGREKAIRNLRYTTRKRLENAKTLDDIW
jgi:hypothetical protein